MEQLTTNMIPNIRAASRNLVRELGFMGRTLAGTNLSASGVHAIIEIGSSNQLTSKDLCDRLLLEKSTVSRLVRSLIDAGLVQELRSDEDARAKHLRLSHKGETTLAAINAFAEEQVSAAIAPLTDKSRRTITAGLQDYAAALRASRQTSETGRRRKRAIIKDGCVPGLIGRVVAMHAAYYGGRTALGTAFEAKVAGGLAEFSTRLDRPDNAIWGAYLDGRIVGSIAIDGEDLDGNRAHLRWFIVDGVARGTGVGRQLIDHALAFCDERGFTETHLWTIEGLDAARHLYERNGFVLTEEYVGDQWGTPMAEQKFVRPRGSANPATAA